MEAESSIAEMVIAWIPFLFQLAITVWLTLKLIGVLRTMAAAQEGILAKLNDIDRRLAAKGILPPDAT